MEVTSRYDKGIHLFWNNLFAGFVLVFIQLRLNGQSLGRRRIGYEVDYRHATFQWPAPPVLGDVAEHSMLNFVPFTGAWRKMPNMNDQLQLE